MSAADVTAAPDSLSLALAFHHAPGHFPELLRGVAPLPEDMGRLLRVAGGTAAAEELPPENPFGAADVRTAARFFIEQVLLARGADHYRVLGVNADAPLEQIKEHHRLLMRVFHPDRKEDASVVADSIAARINLAYNALRLPDDRAAYDARRREAAAAVHVARAVPRARIKAGAAPGGPALPPWLARYLPQWVLAGVALVATAAVGWVYVNQEPQGALGGGGGFANGSSVQTAEVRLPIREPLPKVAPVEAKDAPRVAVLRPAAATAKEEPAPVREEPARVEAPVREAEAARKPEPPAPEPPAPERPRKAEPAPSEPPRIAPPAAPAENVKLALSRTVRTEAQPAASAPAMAAPTPTPAPAPAPTFPAPIEAPVKIASAQPPAVSTPQAAAAPPPAVVPAPVNTPAVVAAVPAPEQRRGVTLDDLVKLVAQFSSEYERGDLERFLALFDEGARVEGGGKDRIRTDYADLFRTTQARQLLIWDMKWAAEGELYRGEGQYRARVQRQGEDALRTYTGKIRIDAVPGSGGVPRVKGLFH